MTSDFPYQNQDLGTRNPFTPVEAEPTETHSEPTKPTKFKIPSDPKIKLLLVLGIIIIILSILSLVVTAIRKSQLKGPVVRATPTPAAITIQPTETPIITIPLDLNAKFEKIDKNTQTDIQFTPPQIDPDIGL